MLTAPGRGRKKICCCQVYDWFYVVCYKYMRVELEMFKLKKENPRNHSNLIQNGWRSTQLCLSPSCLWLALHPWKRRFFRFYHSRIQYRNIFMSWIIDIIVGFSMEHNIWNRAYIYSKEQKPIYVLFVWAQKTS